MLVLMSMMIMFMLGSDVRHGANDGEKMSSSCYRSHPPIPIAIAALYFRLCFEGCPKFGVSYYSVWALAI